MLYRPATGSVGLVWITMSGKVFRIALAHPLTVALATTARAFWDSVIRVSISAALVFPAPAPHQLPTRFFVSTCQAVSFCIGYGGKIAEPLRRKLQPSGTGRFATSSRSVSKRERMRL